MATKKAATVEEYHFKLEYPFTLRGKRKIRGNQDGLLTVTDKDLADELRRCHGVHEIDGKRVAAIEAMRKLGERAGSDEPSGPSSTRKHPQPKPPAGDAPRSAQEKAAQQKAAMLAEKAKADAEAAAAAADTKPNGDEVVGDVLDADEAAPLTPEVVELKEDEEVDDDEELVNADAIMAMTKAELRELLTDWEVEQPPADATKAVLQQAALAALPDPATAEG